MPVLRDVERLVVVQQFDDVVGRRRVDDRAADELVHGFVVARFAGVVHEARAADVYAAGEEGHADGLVVRDALQGAEDVGAFEVLVSVC